MGTTQGSNGDLDWDEDPPQGPPDPIDVLAHREHDDCAFLFGRECDCGHPGVFAKKLASLGLTIVPGLTAGSVKLHEEAMSWTDPFDHYGRPRNPDHRKAADLETQALFRTFLTNPDRLRTRFVLTESLGNLTLKAQQEEQPEI